MSFFLQGQSELLTTINFVLAPLWGGYSAVVVLGCVGVLLLTVLVVYHSKRHQMISGRTLLGAMAVVWLPLLLQCLWNAVVDIRDDIVLARQPLAEQVRSRYCQVDVAQQLGGGLCGVPPFVDVIKSEVPAGSTVAIAASAGSPYLEYQLAAEYSLGLPPEQSDYFVIYQTWEALAYAADGGLYRNPGTDSSASSSRAAEYLGKYSVQAQLAPHQLILKRLK